MGCYSVRYCLLYFFPPTTPLDAVYLGSHPPHNITLHGLLSLRRKPALHFFLFTITRNQSVYTVGPFYYRLLCWFTSQYTRSALYSRGRQTVTGIFPDVLMVNSPPLFLDLLILHGVKGSSESIAVVLIWIHLQCILFPVTLHLLPHLGRSTRRHAFGRCTRLQLKILLFW